MLSIGPQFPPHLQKRKRGLEEDETGRLDSGPPAKLTRQTPPDEGNGSGSDDDGYGPQVAAPLPNPPIEPSAPVRGSDDRDAAPRARGPIGPSLPPSAARTTRHETPLPSSNYDANIIQKGVSVAAPAPLKRTYGPAPPPAPLDERLSAGPDSPALGFNDESPDDDSDDGYGPALPSADQPLQGLGATAPARGSAQDDTGGDGVPRRDDWMLAPPTSTGYRVTDPTKLKARKFASGRSARGDGSSKGVSAIWTETPEEKAKRLADAVLGRPGGADAPSTSAAVASARNAAAEDEESARVRQYTEQTRGRSLYKEHQEQRKSKKSAAATGTRKPGASGAEDDDDDPSKRTFDREKDMGLGGRISGSQRRELLNRAADFGTRFQKGKYL